MNRKTRLYLILTEEYKNCPDEDENDSVSNFYLDIMDKLWYAFSDKEIEYVTKQLASGTVLKPSTES